MWENVTYRAARQVELLHLPLTRRLLTLYYSYTSPRRTQFVVNPHILHPDPGPLCPGVRRTADRGPNIPERLCSEPPSGSIGSAELADGAGQQRPRTGTAREGGAALGPGPKRGRAAAGALPERRYKTEAPGSLKALREAGGTTRALPLKCRSR